MKMVRKRVALLLILVFILSLLSGCEFLPLPNNGGGDSGGTNIGGENPGGENTDSGNTGGGTSTLPESIRILIDENITLDTGETLQLITDAPEGFSEDVVWTASNGCVSITEFGLLRGESEGFAFVTASLGDLYDRILVEVKGESDPIVIDPYVNMSAYEFYRNYEPATSYMDSYYRTLHGFMSGSIDDQDQEPTISAYQPAVGGLYVKNSAMSYSPDGNAYYVYNSYGEIVNIIYRGGAYITLEEVAAYVFAFGDIPANYVSSKSTKPQNSIWGEYLRLNNTEFSGSTTKYPYEPALPNISGIGGILRYYEIDIGTTGTDCDPAYKAAIYNNGKTITRGAARIVYARFYKSGGKIEGIDNRYVFYTYNHYNDFQEYLNYEGGWGEMFGNITGGGTISSKYDYNPTPYVAVTLADIRNLGEIGEEIAWIDEKSYIELVFIDFVGVYAA